MTYKSTSIFADAGDAEQATGSPAPSVAGISEEEFQGFFATPIGSHHSLLGSPRASQGAPEAPPNAATPTVHALASPPGSTAESSQQGWGTPLTQIASLAASGSTAASGVEETPVSKRIATPQQLTMSQQMSHLDVPPTEDFLAVAESDDDQSATAADPLTLQQDESALMQDEPAQSQLPAQEDESLVADTEAAMPVSSALQSPADEPVLDALIESAASALAEAVSSTLLAGESLSEVQPPAAAPHESPAVSSALAVDIQVCRPDTPEPSESDVSDISADSSDDDSADDAEQLDVTFSPLGESVPTSSAAAPAPGAARLNRSTPAQHAAAASLADSQKPQPIPAQHDREASPQLPAVVQRRTAATPTLQLAALAISEATGSHDRTSVYTTAAVQRPGSAGAASAAAESPEVSFGGFGALSPGSEATTPGLVTHRSETESADQSSTPAPALTGTAGALQLSEGELLCLYSA